MTYSLAAASSGQVFSHAHIAVTAAVTGAAGPGRGPGGRLAARRLGWPPAVIAVLSAASVYLWRALGEHAPAQQRRPARLLRQ